MNLTTLLNIRKDSVTSIVGSGGKTTLMFRLAEELRDKGKVLVTTTTKIYVPEKSQYDYLVVGEEPLDKGLGVYVYGREINSENKLTAIVEETLCSFKNSFDYVVIEADGSKGKPLKGWRKDEPVVSGFTSITIGIIDGQSFGMHINEDNIHSLDKFLGNHEGKVMEEDLIKVIFNPEGLFNNSKGRRMLFINKVDNEEIHIRLSGLLSEIINKNIHEKLLDKILIGSLNNDRFNFIEFER